MFPDDPDALPPPNDGEKKLPYDPVPNFEDDFDAKANEEDLKELRQMRENLKKDDGKRVAYRYIGQDQERGLHEALNGYYVMVRVKAEPGKYKVAQTLEIVHRMPISAENFATWNVPVEDYEEIGMIDDAYRDVLGMVNESNMVLDVFNKTPYVPPDKIQEKVDVWYKMMLSMMASDDAEQTEREALENARDMVKKQMDILNETRLYHASKNQKKDLN